ncbi:PASTA domain-containing protein [Microbispora sp. RL4-1S]|uniref:PASTA domain-containing protein n=1 Tax=Microbispora oryzae TaxID=2806554 RepID=A0A940WTG5_9ACTN|nr:PASTA domain-containing protein [Microbispora oryzae]MBP2706791.1 PASTA domain-containing protein [Microbispora oryzae]
MAGLPLDQAQQRIEQDYPGASVRTAPADIPPSLSSYVISDRVETCSPYAVVLELGTRMPELHDMTLEDATATLAATRVRISFLPQEAGLDWTVVTQNPGAGELIHYDTSADVEVVAPVSPSPSPTPEATPTQGPVAPPPSTVTVPSVEGMDLTQARRTLASADLPLRLHPDSPRAGTVAGQDPAAGSRVARGTMVTVRLAAAKEQEDHGPGASAGATSTIVTGALAVVLVLIVIGFLARGVIRGRPTPPPPREARPRPPSVVYVAHADPAPVVKIRLTERTPRTTWPGVQVEAHADPGRQELRETRR